MKKLLLAVSALMLCFTAMAQVTTKTYTYPGDGALYDGTRRANATDYKTTQACLDDGDTLLKAKRAADGVTKNITVRCEGKTYITNELVPRPADPPPMPPVVVNPPVVSMPPGIAVSKPYPAGDPGYGTERLAPLSNFPGLPGIGGPYDVGAFRLQCKAAFFSNDDPIVYPGQSGKSHLHVFFGNTGVNANTTTDSLTTTGNSTCNGGTINRTGYWAPAMVNTTTGQAVRPEYADFYYKTGYNGVRPAQVKPYPRGLRMIAGDPMNKADVWGASFRYVCHNTLSPAGRLIEGHTFVSCPVGDYMTMEVMFPQCWDGVNLDSPDHKSHMAYPSGGCPPSHPVALPEYSMHIHYLVTAPGIERQWRLSSDTYDGPAGYSAHGDWWNGWNQQRMETWVRECDNKALDCHSHLLDSQTVMY